MRILLIVLIISTSLLLIKAADMLVVGLRRLSNNTQSGMFAMSAILLAIGTSFPELFVALTSSLEGTPNLSLGNVLGANIANLSFVAGLAGLLGGRVRVHGNFLKKDLAYALIAGLLPLIFVLDGTLSRVDGLILLTIYGAYASSLFRKEYSEVAEEHRKEGTLYRFFRILNVTQDGKSKEYLRIFLGIALLLLSSDIITKLAKTLAVDLNIPVFLVGLIVLSIGTTLPEVAFAIRSIIDREPTMFFGNMLGSIIANSTLVVGVAATISPITVVAFDEYWKAAAMFVIIYTLMWFFIRTKRTLERWEAGVLLMLFAIFVLIEII